jgi:hypothetical protein
MIYNLTHPQVKVQPHPNPPGYRRDYDFSPDADWFSRHMGVWWAIMEPLAKEGISYLEIGVYEGRSLLWVWDNLHPRHMEGADPFPSSAVLQRFSNNCKLADMPLSFCVTLTEGANYLRGCRSEFDLIYIDGDHRARPTLEHAILAHPLLRPGGLLIFDDYLWRLDRPKQETPQMAIDVFWALWGDEYEVVHWDWQVILRRLPEGAGRKAA